MVPRRFRVLCSIFSCQSGGPVSGGLTCESLSGRPGISLQELHYSSSSLESSTFSCDLRHMTWPGGTVLVMGMKYITCNAKGVCTIPFFRLDVSEAQFPLYQLLVALGLTD